VVLSRQLRWLAIKEYPDLCAPGLDRKGCWITATKAHSRNRDLPGRTASNHEATYGNICPASTRKRVEMFNGCTATMASGKASLAAALACGVGVDANLTVARVPVGCGVV